MPKSGEGATACLKMGAGTPDVQNKNVLFLYTGLNISRQTEGTKAYRSFYHQDRLAGPHLYAYSPRMSFHERFHHANRKRTFSSLEHHCGKRLCPKEGCPGLARSTVQPWAQFVFLLGAGDSRQRGAISSFWVQEIVGSKGLYPPSSTFRASTQLSVAWIKCQPCQRNGDPNRFVQTLWSNSEVYH